VSARAKKRLYRRISILATMGGYRGMFELTEGGSKASYDTYVLLE
jgi:hypothetical protein